MAADRPSDDDLEEISYSRPDKPPEYGQSHADVVAAEPEMAETRTPAEYYHALRAAVDRAFDRTGQSADAGRRSAWDDIPAANRPPLDALRVPPERAAHILDGDATGGGHRYGQAHPAKRSFPLTGTTTQPSTEF